MMTNIFEKFAHVKARNPAQVLSKISSLAKLGVSQLQVLSDFDGTLTKKFGPNGELCWTSHAVIENLIALENPELAVKAKEMAAHYIPIEFSHTLTTAEKIPHMIEWWEEAHKLTVDANIHYGELEAVVQESLVFLRDKCAQFFAALEAADVPLIIFSAGIGDVIDIFLKQRLGQISPNVHVIANFTDFDEKGTVIGFKRPLIHTFNKNSSVIPEEQPKFFERLHSRPNVLLLGDTIGDSHMDLGLDEPESSVVLKIGFINKDPENLLDSYLDVYDIVVLEDQSFDVIMAIWEEISSAVPNAEH